MNLLEHTSRVSFELSNRCNYAHQHKHCPLYLKRNDEPVILEGRIIEDVIGYLERNKWKGKVSFHTYNEPLIDPRLIYIIRAITEPSLCKMMPPQIKPVILTNGYYLTQDIAIELEDAGVEEIVVSAYSDAEEERLKKIKVDIPYKVIRRKLDDRLYMYVSDLANYQKVPCYAPLSEICIACTGEVRLCCYDWQNEHTFGNLYKDSFEDVLKRMKPVYDRLIQGDRYLHLCQRCESSR
jgi:2-deoxy-scyllo-inosamine dehydrogenase (SAM-dependent)